MTPDQAPDPIAVALSVAAMLERLGIAYVVGGILASAVYGELRSTNDVDLVVRMELAHVAPLAQALRERFYVSEAAMGEAVRLGTSFNAIHLSTGVKLDMFVAGQDAFDAERLTHRVPTRIRLDPPGELFLDTAEHIVLRKLEWYRRGGETSERQWRDVVGVLRTQGSRLDRAGLGHWAERLGVTDLLERAMREI
ncbi:MAG: hypothetical protein ACRENQ_13210 [Gemmatimonadaceae bacterium]